MNLFRTTQTFIICHCLTILLCIGHQDTKAQHVTEPEGMYVKVFNIEQGLNQSMVRNVIQDRQGWIWVVTGDGLQVFDGVSFKTFRVSAGSGTDEKDNLMRGIAEFAPGHLVVTTSASILDFCIDSGTFRVLWRKPGHYPEILLPAFRGSPLIWIPGQGFGHFSSSRLEILNMQSVTQEKIPADFSPVQSALSGKGDTVVISGSNGIIELYPEPGEEKKLLYHFFPLQNKSGGLTADSEGKLWIAIDDEIRAYKNGTIGEVRFKLQNHTFSRLFTDRNNTLWASDFFSQKIYRIAHGSPEEVKLYNRQGKFIETISASVVSWFEDKHGNLWIGTDGNGLLFYGRDDIPMRRALTGFVRCISGWRDDLVAGTFMNGLWKLSKDLGRAERLNLQGLTGADDIYDLCSDAEDRLWIATHKEIIVLKTDKEVLTRFGHTLNKPRLLRLQNRIIAAGGGWMCFDPGAVPALVAVKDFPTVNSMKVEKDRLLVANEFGLYRLPIDFLSNDSKFSEVAVAASSLHCYDVSRAGNHYWVATGMGIRVFSDVPEELPVPGYLKTLIGERIYCLEKDAQNRIWFSTNKGIGCVLTESEKVIMPGIGKNLQSAEFNQNASYHDETGKVYFGGIYGMNMIDTRQIITDRTGPTGYLARYTAEDTLASAGIPTTPVNICISRHRPHIRGSVTTMDYSNTEGQKYSFLLEGYHSNWGAATKHPDFEFRNLTPGLYTLWVKCTDAFGNTGIPSKLMIINIKPALYQKPWVRLMAAILAIALIIVIVKRWQKEIYRRRIEKIQKQHALERERLRISQDMHDEIGSGLTRISILSSLAIQEKNNTGRQIELLEQISGIAGEVVDEMGEIIWALNPKNDSKESLIAFIRQYTGNFLDSIGIEPAYDIQEDGSARNFSSEIRRNLFLIVKEALHNVAKHSGATKVRLKITSSGDSFVMSITDNGNGLTKESAVRGGNGLNNMQLRAASIGGKIKTGSLPAGGYFVTFEGHFPAKHE
jgi:signal transduction histidine kinase/ligand-binding sensor domain-containing protein